MKFVIRSLLLVVLLSALISCAPTTKLSRDDVLQRHDEIATLQSHLQQAEENGVAYLAPTGYRESKSLLEQAIKSGQAERADANTLASKGLERLSKAETDAETSRNVMREVLVARDRALEANAPNLEVEMYRKLEQELKDATMLVEGGNIEKAKSERPDLIAGYSEVELAALKKDTVELRVTALRARKSKMRITMHQRPLSWRKMNSSWL